MFFHSREQIHLTRIISNIFLSVRKKRTTIFVKKNTDYLVLGTLSLLTGDCPTPKNILRLDCHVRSFKNMVYTNAPYKSKEYPEY